jgi:fucose permease
VKKNYFIVGLVLLTFFVISFLTNIIGPLIPEIINSFSLSLTLVSFLPFSFFVAYGFMSIPAGVMTEKFGGKFVMLFAFGIAFIGALLFGLFPKYNMAIISLFLIGSGMAMLQVVINPLLRSAGGEAEFSFYSLMGQLFFGLASFLSPLVYTYLSQNMSTSNNTLFYLLKKVVPVNLTWVSFYWVFAVISLIMILVIAAFNFPKIELKEDEKAGALKVHIELLKNKTVLLYFLGIFCYVGSEQGVANWISQFLFTYHTYDPQTVGAQVVSWFWGMMTAGTFVGLILVKLFDTRNILILFTALAIFSLSIALFGGASITLYAFPAVGFFIAVMYPIIISLGLNSVAKHHGSFAGILMTGICGGAIIPLIVGILGDYFTLKYGMLFLYITFGFILSIGLWAKPLINNSQIK